MLASVSDPVTSAAYLRAVSGHRLVYKQAQLAGAQIDPLTAHGAELPVRVTSEYAPSLLVDEASSSQERSVSASYPA